MSKRIGKISVIKRDRSGSQVETMEKGLSSKGMTRVPGTGVFKYPYKEVSGKCRSGLDPDASYIKRIQDPHEREIEISRVKSLRAKLEEALGGIDLNPHSKFWNYALSTSMDDKQHVQPYKLTDGDNLFNLNNPAYIVKTFFSTIDIFNFENIIFISDTIIYSFKNTRFWTRYTALTTPKRKSSLNAATRETTIRTTAALPAIDTLSSPEAIGLFRFSGWPLSFSRSNMSLIR